MLPTPRCAIARAMLTGLLFACLIGGAGAQQPTQPQADAIRQSCRGDFQSHCAGVSPGGSAALQCLQSNVASLSPACRTAVAATQPGTAPPPTAAQAPPPAAPAPPPREEMARMREACGADFRAHCRGVALGGGRAMACLADHRESLSPGCQQALATMHR